MFTRCEMLFRPGYLANLARHARTLALRLAIGCARTIPIPPGAYMLSSGYTTATGRPVPFAYLAQVCGSTQGTGIVRIHLSCLAAKGFHISQIYQPAARYWPLQAFDSASLTAAAVLLLGMAAWWTTRRVS